MRRTAGRREGRSDLDLLVLVVGAVSLAVYWQRGFDGFLSRDLAIYAYGAQRFADGVPPYLGILNRAGPLAHIIPSVGVAGARLTGIDELLGMRLLFLGISVACVCMVYLLGRDLFSSRLAGLGSAAAFLTFGGFITYAAGGPREKTAMVLFLLCSLWATRKQSWFAAGVFLGLATLVLQLAFLPGLTATAAGVLALGNRRVRNLTRFAAGGLVTVLLALGYFTAVEAVREAVDAFLVINAGYSDAHGFFTQLPRSWYSFRNGYGPVGTWVVVGGLAALVILSVSGLLRWRRPEPREVPLAAFGLSGVVAVVWTLRDFDSWPDAFLVLPYAAIGVGALAAVAVERLSRPAARSIVLAWTLVAVVVAAQLAVNRQDHRLAEQRRSVAAVVEHLPADATFMSLNAPQALVLTGKTNPSRFQTFSSGLDRYVAETYPGGMQGFVRDTRRRRPTVITHYGGMRSFVSRILGERYARVGRAPGWTWYVDSSLGPDAIRALRRAVRAGR
jgi:hypothetical protein